MKIIEVNGQTYARHWFRWYWVLNSSLYPIHISKGSDDE